MRPLFRPFALAFALTTAVAANAVTFTEDFNVAQTGVTLNNLGGGANPVLFLPTSSRTITMTQLENDDPGFARSRANIKNGAFNFSNDVEVRSNYALDYEYFAGLDLSGTTGFKIDFLSNDLAYGLSVVLTDMAGGVTTFTGNAGAGLSPYSVLVGSGTGNADLASVRRISFRSDVAFKGVDSSIERIQSVPEPASMAALGLGAMGLLRRRRRKA